MIEKFFRYLKKWFKSAAGKLSIIMIVASMLLLLVAWSTIGSSFMTERDANTANNILIGIATNLLGIVVTVSFVQYFLDKQDDEEKCRNEIKTIKRYDKYMQTLIRRYFMFYISVTTRLKNRNMVDVEHSYEHNFEFSDLADMYQTSMYLSEGFLDSSIELFYQAEEKLRDYMLKMIENIDFKYNPDIEKLLQDFVTKSIDIDMRGQILGATNTRLGKNQKLSEYVSKEIANESNDWLGKFEKGELQGNLMIPYVLLYYNIKDQIRMIKKYLAYMKEIELKRHAGG